MGSEKTLKCQIVTEYLEKYPELPTLTLAKVIYEHNKEVFNDVENVRTVIRNYRGALGVEHLNLLSDRRFIRDKQKPYNPLAMPESDEREFEPFIIPKQYKKILVFNDVHIPYHSVESLNIMLEYAQKEKIDSILINGDLIDFHQLSNFIKDPRKRHLKQELDATKEFLESIKLFMPNVKIFYKIGNHEERLENYLKLKAPELLDLSEYNLDILLRCGEKNIDVIKDKRIIKFGKLNVLHGHELGKAIIQPVNAARGVFLKTKENTLVGHFHTDSKHSEPSLNNNHISCWSIGCLCELHPEYAVINKWVRGFAIIELINESGNFIVETKQIIKNKVV